ncbi:hypothetical protein GE107_01610 [Cohnella sp. CFH 77786]|uniref:hypothetical protein n=1 Tax=Cohnella sp. CFH 77786 TaxID=2662265 RepID=UPI001C60F336|nr:hypothetical protein [Cohnella sp. CFH 77786]MBW5444762.1 hypothetical protein [Cohnella sp. CFH 77786]
MCSLIAIPEIERKIIQIGKFDSVNYVAKNNTIRHAFKDWQDETSKKPLTSKLPRILAPKKPDILYDGIAGAFKTISKKRSAFDYIEVPHEIASTELLWKGSVRPELNKFYVMSPKNNKVYFPFDNYHSLAFEDKVSEAIRIFLHLKPKELLIVHEEGYECEIKSNADFAKSKLVKGTGDLQLEKKTNKRIMFRSSYPKPGFLKGLFSTPPQLPQDLIWYPTEEKWQVVVEGILNDSSKEFEMQINYHEDFGLNSNLQAEIMKQANIKASTNITQFQRTSWKVAASFW